MVVGNLKDKYLYREEYLKMIDVNLRVRVRMSIIYIIVNNLGYLVVGIDNVVEIYIGYFIKFGDGGVDILFIVNLIKGEVYEWVKEFGVYEDLINKVFLVGFWEG